MTTIPQFRQGDFTPSIPPTSCAALQRVFETAVSQGELAPAFGIDLRQPHHAPLPSPLRPAETWLLGKALQGSAKQLPGSLSSEQHEVVPPSHETPGTH